MGAGDFADNADTVDGRFSHRNVDKQAGALPSADEPLPETLHARSVLLSAPALGMIARMDLLEADGSLVTPIDYKRGRAPDVPEGAWEPERVQLCAQGLILEENGYQVERGELYFVTSKQRVSVEFDTTLRARTLQLLAELREVGERREAPPPLRDSPKCPRCSLVGICLPDETNLLRDLELLTPEEPETETPSEANARGRVRRLVPARDDRLPLYVHTAGSKVGRSGGELVVETRDGAKQTTRLSDTSHLAVFGAVQVSTQALHSLCEHGISVLYLSSGGWLQAIARGMDHKNVELRQRQFAPRPTRIGHWPSPSAS